MVKCDNACVISFRNMTCESSAPCLLEPYLGGEGIVCLESTSFFSYALAFPGERSLSLVNSYFSLLDSRQSLEGGNHPWRLCGLLEIS